MVSGSALKVVWVALTSACLVPAAGGCGTAGRTETATQSASGSTQPELGCKKAGIRYTGKTAQGVEVCFTLTPDGRTWLETGFRFLRGNGCPNPPAAFYDPGPSEATNPMRVDYVNAGFVTGRIRGERASGVVMLSDFCRDKKFEWSARSTQAVPAQALRNLEPEPSATGLCTRPGIHYTGETTQGGVKVCFTLNSYGSSLVESGWSFDRASGCDTGGLVVQNVEQWGDPTDLDAAGHFDESFGHGLKGAVRGVKASGVLADADDCGSKTFKWSARRTP